MMSTCSALLRNTKRYPRPRRLSELAHPCPLLPRISLRPLLTTVCGLIVLCGLSPAVAGEEPRPRKWQFAGSDVTLAADFDGAAVAEAAASDADTIEVVIRPENTPINNSAWYAFRVAAERPRRITVRLVYENGNHRYRPKLSRDGLKWQPIAGADYEPGKREAVLRLDVGPEPLWVAGQELWNTPRLTAWMDRIVEHADVTRRVAGRSIRGAAIEELVISASEEPNMVILLGRQHPPEVTGTLGLVHFVERLLEDDELASAFRRRFHVLLFPLVNPDGVSAGHWRHNMAGVDLNRDWGPFEQPETRAVRDAILGYRDDRGWRPYLLLDFHSTGHDVFYVPAEDAEYFPPGFVNRWLDRLDARLPDYRVRRQAVSGTGRPLAQRWGYRELGIASVTYEFGDGTDRDLIRTTTRAAAEEAMDLLLAVVRRAAEPAGTAGGR
ncbi:MAG: M14 family metallopeptidase [Thermoguttaceae bacterium]|nr:M14 family metallopeptidase [Thermoguttaceae bacterium]